jgi:hypothetical protein
MSDDITAIFDRIAAGRHDRRDVETLRNVMVRGDRNVVQLGSHNIALHGGREIHIDNRVYYGAEVDAIRHVVAGLPGRGSLRSVGGFVSTVGMLVALAGMGMFFYGLISAMAGNTADFDGPPPIVLTGFAVAAAGVGLSIVGGLVLGWTKARP